jgi:hypothetical protein
MHGSSTPEHHSCASKAPGQTQEIEADPHLPGQHLTSLLVTEYPCLSLFTASTVVTWLLALLCLSQGNTDRALPMAIVTGRERDLCLFIISSAFRCALISIPCKLWPTKSIDLSEARNQPIATSLLKSRRCCQLKLLCAYKVIACRAVQSVFASSTYRCWVQQL